MPSRVHELVAERVKVLIQSKLQDLSHRSICNDSTRELIGDIISSKSTRIRLDNGSIREPDEQFSVRGLHFPGLVVEIACSQRAHDLAVAADDYLVESEGNIRAVLGLRTSAGKEKEAEVQLWRPKLTHYDQDEDVMILESEKVLSEVSWS